MTASPPIPGWLALRVKPLADVPVYCSCAADQELKLELFTMPGLWPLAEATCPRCRRKKLAHLPHGWGGNGKLLVDLPTDSIEIDHANNWYRAWFAEAMTDTAGIDPPILIDQRRPINGRMVVVNCLDGVYGHFLDRIFCCQAIANRLPGIGILAIVPRAIAWLVPDYVDEVWVVDAPFRDQRRRMPGLARKFEERIAALDDVYLAHMFTENCVDIERFTKIAPYRFDRPPAPIAPKLTYVWRDDRCWTYRGNPAPGTDHNAQQAELVSALANRLRLEIPRLDVAVIGHGTSQKLQPGIADLRFDVHDAANDRAAIERCAQSDVVVGVHGSNMILPAAHAASAVELVVAHFWSHTVTTWSWLNRMPATSALQRYRLLPMSSSLTDIASVVYGQIARVNWDVGRNMLGQIEDPRAQYRFRIDNPQISLESKALPCLDPQGRVL